jgi:hypothetical protein
VLKLVGTIEPRSCAAHECLGDHFLETHDWFHHDYDENTNHDYDENTNHDKDNHDNESSNYNH